MTKTNAERFQKLHAHRARRHAGGSLAGGGALQHVARVVRCELDHARKICMPRAHARYTPRRNVAPLGRHIRLPIFKVAVEDGERQRAPQRDAVSYARHDLGAVLFDLLPAAPAVAALAERKRAVDARKVEGQPRGHPL